MKEILEKDLIQLFEQSKFPYAVYFYSPFCGTCKVTERMLDIAEEVGPCIPIFKANIFYYRSLTQEWQIQSVPCLCIFQKGKMANKINAFQSVDYIYEQIKS